MTIEVTLVVAVPDGLGRERLVALGDALREAVVERGYRVREMWCAQDVIELRSAEQEWRDEPGTQT